MSTRLLAIPRTHHARTCDQCGKTYNRRNLVEVWTVRQIGSLIGWFKVEIRLCNECMPERVAQRVCILAHFQPRPKSLPLPATKNGHDKR